MLAALRRYRQTAGLSEEEGSATPPPPPDVAESICPAPLGREGGRSGTRCLSPTQHCSAFVAQARTSEECTQKSPQRIRTDDEGVCVGCNLFTNERPPPARRNVCAQDRVVCDILSSSWFRWIFGGGVRSTSKFGADAVQLSRERTSYWCHSARTEDAVAKDTCVESRLRPTMEEIVQGDHITRTPDFQRQFCETVDDCSPYSQGLAHRALSSTLRCDLVSNDRDNGGAGMQVDSLPNFPANSCTELHGLGRTGHARVSGGAALATELVLVQPLNGRCGTTLRRRLQSCLATRIMVVLHG